MGDDNERLAAHTQQKLAEYKVSTLYSGTKVDTGCLRANRFQFVSCVAVHFFVLGAKLMFKNGGCQGEME